MVFKIPQFFLARGVEQWVQRFLLLIGDTIRFTHDFLPHKKNLSWWEILHQTYVALQFSLSCAPCHTEGLWGCPWSAPKWTKMHQNGHCIMTEQSVSNLSWVTLMIHFWIKWTLERGSEAVQVIEGSWGRSLGAPKCLKMPQNATKWSLYHDRAKCFEFVLSD